MTLIACPTEYSGGSGFGQGGFSHDHLQAYTLRVVVPSSVNLCNEWPWNEVVRCSVLLVRREGVLLED